MKSILNYLIIIMVALAVSCCAKDESKEYPRTSNQKDTEKDPDLPVGKAKIHILFIGNSFTLDATDHLPGILKASGVDNIYMERAFHGGYTLVGYNDNFSNSGVCARYKYSPTNGSWIGDKTYSVYDSSLEDFFDGDPYDIVVLQEYTGSKYSWSGYAESGTGIKAVQGLIDKINSRQPNHRPAFVYLMSQTFARGSSLLTTYFGNDRGRMFSVITAHVKLMMEQTFIDKIIPTGTMLENLRTSSLNIDNGMDLSRDLFHMDMGISRYGASCVVFETIIGPCVGKTMDGNTYRYSVSNTSPTWYTTPVTDVNAPIALAATRFAISNPFLVTNMKNY